MFSGIAARPVPDNSAAKTPVVHISYGQSWRTNSFNTIGGFGFNPQAQTLLALKTTTQNPMAIGAGVFLSGTVNGISHYSTDDAFSIGRCAAMAYQLLCVRDGNTPLNPILEFCVAYPGSTWTTGGGGGLQPGGTSWTNQATIIAAMAGLLPNVGAYPKLDGPLQFKSVGYTQGPAGDETQASKISDLTAMLTDYDALDLPGAGTSGLIFYLGLPAATSDATTFNTSYFGTYVFGRTNAPGQGGTWSGRCFMSSPSYPWQFNGADNIHTGDYGTARWGELEGYIKKRVEIDGVAWTPLWRPLSGGAITVAGQVITIPWARPAGSDFASGTLAFQDNADDGIKDWPNKGFNVIRGGTSTLTITNVAISGLNTLLTISETLSPSDSLEVSYAQYGPGGTNPGSFSGVGGNLMMRGPASVLFPSGFNGSDKYIDAWAWPFIETVTV